MADPLSFGDEHDALEDLTAQLDALGDGDDVAASAAGAAAAADPFADLAQQQPPQAPPPTYGQLVEQQQQQQQQQEPLMAATAAAAATQPAQGAAAVSPLDAAAASTSAAAAAAAAAAALGGGAAGSSLASPRLGSGDGQQLPAAAAALQPNAELPLVVTVTEPVRRDAPGVLGMKGGYVEYTVTTRSSLPGWASPEVAVRRRFRDFVSLAELLKAQYRGYFVPPRPEKNAVEGSVRMGDAFVEERRAALQRYLQRLAAHPAVGPSEELKTFLETPGDLAASFRWSGMLPASASLAEGAAKLGLQLVGRESRVVDPVAAAQPAARSKDLLRAVKEAAQGAGMRGGRDVPLEELDLRRLREGCEGMRDQLAETTRAAEKLVGRLDQLGAAAGDLGLSLFKAAKFEEAEGGALASHTGTLRHAGALIADEKRAAAALVRLSKLLARVTGRTAQELGALHDALAATPAALRGYGSREHQMVTWHTLENDLEARRRALADAERARNQRRVDDLRGDIARLELSVTAAKAEYERLKAANLSETARWAAERRGEYCAMAGAFAATQLAAAERAAEVWVQLAGELGATAEQLAAARVVPLPAAAAGGAGGGGGGGAGPSGSSGW